jgi:prepilin-type N-terminal cleavage/methylation domain-containing protein
MAKRKETLAEAPLDGAMGPEGAGGLKRQGGYTLIELITVIAIVGILAAIAVPLLLGHREKARVTAVRASAKGSVAEIQGIMDAFAASDPFLVMDSSGNEICVDSSIPLPARTCQLVYRQAAGGSYTDIHDIIGYIIANYQGKQQKSPYGAWWLFVDAPTGNMGEIVITNATARKVLIKAYASDPTTPIFNTSVPQQ